MINQEGKHWVCFTYVGDGGSFGSVYIGQSDPLITLERIEANKAHAKMPSNSVLTAAIHLGYMSESEFEGTT